MSKDGDTSDPDATKQVPTTDRPASAPTRVEIPTLARRNSPVTIDLARFGKRVEKAVRIESFVHGATPDAGTADAPAGAANGDGPADPTTTGQPVGDPTAALVGASLSGAPEGRVTLQLGNPSASTLKGLPIALKKTQAEPAPGTPESEAPAVEAPAPRSLTRTLLNLPKLPARLLNWQPAAPKPKRVTPGKPLFRLDDSDWYLTKQRGEVRRNVFRWILAGLIWAGVTAAVAWRWKQGWRPW